MKSQTIKVRDRFGEFLADGNAGNLFRMCELEPALHGCEQVVLDFHGVENMTDSFANACFANLAKNHLPEIRTRLRFVGCGDIVKSFIVTALSRGAREAMVRAGVSA